jgi:predicted metal-binding protein
MKRMTKHKQTKKLKQKIKTKLMLCALCADLPTPQPASGNMTSATQKQ